MAEPVHYGFPGTVNAQAQSFWLPAVGSSRFGVEGVPDLQVVRNISLDRGISITGGKGWGDGVYSVYDPTVPVATFGLPAPAAGTTRWHMVVARRDWQIPYTVTFPAIDAGPTAVLPVRENNPGVTSDQPLALVEVIAGQSTVGTIIDLRCWVGSGGLIAKHERALDYLEKIGQVVKIDGVTWSYELGVNDVPGWEKDRSAGDVSIFGQGWTALAGNHKPRLYRQDDMVYLVGAVSLAAGGQFSNLLTVANEFRPASSLTMFVGSGVTSSGINYELVLANGVLSIPAGYRDGSLAVGAVVPVTASWPRV